MWEDTRGKHRRPASVREEGLGRMQRAVRRVSLLPAHSSGSPGLQGLPWDSPPLPLARPPRPQVSGRKATGM